MLGPKCGYIEILDHFTEEHERAQADTNKYFPLRPSSAGKCGRELAYALMEYRGHATYPDKEVKTPEVTRLLSLGHSVEYSLLKQFDYVKDFALKYKQQVLSFFKLPLTGEIIEGSNDAVIWSEKYKCLIDVKSKKEKFHVAFSSDWEALDEKLSKMASVETFGPSCFWVEDLASFIKELNDPFFASNFYQLNLYFHDEGNFLRARGVDHAAIIQYSKNTSRLREVRFKPSEAVYEGVRSKFLAASEAVDGAKSPEQVERGYALGSIACAFCPYKTTCWPDKNALKEYFKTWPKKAWPTDADAALEEIYIDYIGIEQTKQKQETAQAALIDALEKRQIQKVRFSDGAVYELKLLQSPRPHVELRRSKI